MTDKNPPEKIYNVSKSQFSLARHYGGCNFNGHYYSYDPIEDTLTLRIPPKKKTKKGSL